MIVLVYAILSLLVYSGNEGSVLIPLINDIFSLNLSGFNMFAIGLLLAWIAD